MRLRDLLTDNYQEFFNHAGEIDPSNRALNLVADWILEFSDYPEEMWEDPKDAKLIAKACVTTNFDDFAAMAAAIRINARRYAIRLIDDHSDLLNDLYYQRPEPEYDPLMDQIKAIHADYQANF